MKYASKRRETVSDESVTVKRLAATWKREARAGARHATEAQQLEMCHHNVTGAGANRSQVKEHNV